MTDIKYAGNVFPERQMIARRLFVSLQSPVKKVRDSAFRNK